MKPEDHPLVTELGLDLDQLNAKDLQVPQVPEPTTDRFDLVVDWCPTPENLQELFVASLKGLDEQVIARTAAKVSWPVWLRLKELYPVISETLYSGRSQGTSVAAAVVMNTILDVTNKNRVNAAMFFLKYRCGWDEVPAHEVNRQEAKQLIDQLPTEKLLNQLEKPKKAKK